VASLRQPGGTALAIVLDPDGFAATRRRHTGRTDELPCLPILRGAGWTVAVVGSGDDLGSVWSVLSGNTASAGVA
jgi:hypothetical protein